MSESDDETRGAGDQDGDPTGMPGQGEAEPTPLGGVDEEQADDLEYGADAMPGIPTDGEPATSG